MELIRHLLSLAIEVMILAIIASAIISGLRAARVRIPYGNPLVRAVEQLAETMLRPIRNAFPMTAGGLDFSPMVAIIILEILRRAILLLLR